jgi:hypothetical protein
LSTQIDRSGERLAKSGGGRWLEEREDDRGRRRCDEEGMTIAVGI